MKRGPKVIRKKRYWLINLIKEIEKTSGFKLELIDVHFTYFNLHIKSLKTKKLTKFRFYERKAGFVINDEDPWFDDKEELVPVEDLIMWLKKYGK